MTDKLVVNGLGGLDGEYPCDLGAMLSIGSPDTLTNREGHRVKVMSGVRAGELEDALEAGDNDVLLALAAIVLTRAGKRFDEETLWDAPMGAGVTFDISAREEPEGEQSGPPAEQTVTPPTNGGESGSTQSEPNQENDPSSTGHPSWETPSPVQASDQGTSGS